MIFPSISIGASTTAFSRQFKNSRRDDLNWFSGRLLKRRLKLPDHIVGLDKGRYVGCLKSRRPFCVNCAQNCSEAVALSVIGLTFKENFA